jgi:hypothetical protein
VAAISTKARAQTALQAKTSLDSQAVLELVKRAASTVKGGGASLLTSGAMNLGAEAHVEREVPNGLKLSITSGKRLVELCTFSASVSSEDGGTSLRIGGLETYKTSQQRVAGFIPVGPASIAGFSPYKRLLDQVASELRTSDSTAQVSVGGPSS